MFQYTISSVEAIEVFNHHGGEICGMEMWMLGIVLTILGEK